MVKVPSKFKIKQYSIMRVLFKNPSTWNEIVSGTGIDELGIISPLRKSLTHKDIGKKVSGGREFINQYFLTEQGIKKLCFYEYKYAMHHHFKPTYATTAKQHRYISEIVQEQRKQSFVPENQRT